MAVLALFAKSLVRVGLALAAGFLFGLWRVSLVVHQQNAARAYVGRQVEITGVVSEDPRVQDDESTFAIRYEGSLLYVKLTGQHDLGRSDQVTLRGELMSGFGNYDAYFWHPVLVSQSKPDPPDLALRVRDFLASRLESVLDSQSRSGLALGFLLGEKVAIPEDLSIALREVGLAHVVVASGYALSVLTGFARKICGRLSRFAALAGAGLLVVCFIAIVGFSPSLLRAGLATTISLATWYVGRRLHPVRLLLYVAALSLAWRPVEFASVAWQLSFASYAGILLLYPVLAKYFYGARQPGFVASMVLVSIAAQLLCLPLSIYYFGKLAILGILANVLVTPVIPVVMALASIVGITAWQVIAWPLRIILDYQLAAIGYLHDIKWASVEVASGNPAVFIVYLPLIFGLYILYRRSHYDYRPSVASDKSADYGKIFSC